MPNWVGYLITEYSPDNRLLVYDYAVGGDSVIGVRKQVQVNFLPRVGEKPSWALWNAEDTLFSKFLPAILPPFFFYSQFHHWHVHATLPVTWVGINDCAYVLLILTRSCPFVTEHDLRNRRLEVGAVPKTVEELFVEQEALYQAGARNFLFIDVPPIHRSPVGSLLIFYPALRNSLLKVDLQA